MVYKSYTVSIDSIVWRYTDHVLICCCDFNLPEVSWSNDASGFLYSSSSGIRFLCVPKIFALYGFFSVIALVDYCLILFFVMLIVSLLIYPMMLLSLLILIIFSIIHSIFFYDKYLAHFILDIFHYFYNFKHANNYNNIREFLLSLYFTLIPQVRYSLMLCTTLFSPLSLNPLIILLDSYVGLLKN